MLDAKKALEESLKSLNMEEASLNKGTKYSIVEFCNDYLKLPLEETIEISNELLEDMPIVYLKEDNWGDSLQRWMGKKASQYGNQIRSAAQNKFGVGATGNAPKVTQGWNRPLTKIGQKVQDVFNTKGSALRNSPMVRVDDNQRGITKYIAFPDLDLDRPGHKRVLDSIIQGMSKNGMQAQQINIAAPERSAAQQAGNYAEISSPDSGENKKQQVEAALQQLEDLITNTKSSVSSYSFMSAEELAEIQKQIASASNQAEQTVQDAETSMEQDAAAMTQEASAAASAPAGQAQQAASNTNQYAGVKSGQELQQELKGNSQVPQANQPTAQETQQPLETTPINAQQAATSNTTYQVNPGVQSAVMPPGSTFNFQGTPRGPNTPYAPPPATPKLSGKPQQSSDLTEPTDWAHV